MYVLCTYLLPTYIRIYLDLPTYKYYLPTYLPTYLLNMPHHLWHD